MTRIERLLAAAVGFVIGASLCFVAFSILFLIVSSFRDMPVEPIGTARYLFFVLAGLYVASYGFADLNNHENVKDKWHIFFARRDVRVSIIALSCYFLVSIAWFWIKLPYFSEYEWNILFSLPFLVLGIVWLGKIGRRWVSRGTA